MANATTDDIRSLEDKVFKRAVRIVSLKSFEGILYASFCERFHKIRAKLYYKKPALSHNEYCMSQNAAHVTKDRSLTRLHSLREQRIIEHCEGMAGAFESVQRLFVAFKGFQVQDSP